MDQGEARDPRHAFLNDLEEEIAQGKTAGDVIILAIDLTENTWDSDSARTIESWGLINALKTRHPDLPPVAACSINTRNMPIDETWCSPSRQKIQAGMAGFGSPSMLALNRTVRSKTNKKTKCEEENRQLF
jgi:hypothetical protein